LTDGVNEYMRANYRPAPFRDLFFSRQPTRDGRRGSETASAKFTSVLENVTFTSHAENSPILMALKASAENSQNRLSINLMLCGFSKQSTFGDMCGAIGPWNDDDPLSFVAGRRFTIDQASALNPKKLNMVGNANGFGYFDVILRDNQLSADLSNAFPQDENSQAKDLGDLQFAILRTPDVVTGLGTPDAAAKAGILTSVEIGPDQVELLGAVDYQGANWLFAEAGICHLKLSDAQCQLASNLPLAIVQPVGGKYKVMIREAIGGLFTRAETFEFRMDPTKTQPAIDEIHILASQFGRPLPNVQIALKRQAPVDGGSSFRDVLPDVKTPWINQPVNALELPESQNTGPDGWATFQVIAHDPGNPRNYVDGQIYQVGYYLTIAGLNRAPMFEVLVFHVRRAVHVPEHPDWDTDIRPFMQQYDNLYPIMSHRLFSLADPEVARANAKLLSFAFERDFENPNHMPVTRDLSAGKRQIMLNWLADFLDATPANVMPASIGTIPEICDAGPALVAAPQTTVEELEAMIAALPHEDDGKSAAAAAHLRVEIAAIKGTQS
ncbi:MAG: hypothetical protein ACPGRD_05805, partial [Planktomarina sp.]